MSRKCQFAPAPLDGLEARLLLSRAHAVPVVTSTLHASQYVLSPAQQTIVAEVNQAFDSFQSDFDQARATYFASILNQPPPGTAMMTAFNYYTTQRVQLLSQQVLSAFLQGPEQVVRPRGAADPVSKMISTKLIGPQNQAPNGSLANALDTNISPAGSTAPTEALNALSQEVAIMTARSTVINEISILKIGAYGNALKRPKH
jgi:hypothetical protein